MNFFRVTPNSFESFFSKPIYACEVHIRRVVSFQGVMILFCLPDKMDGRLEKCIKLPPCSFDTGVMLRHDMLVEIIIHIYNNIFGPGNVLMGLNRLGEAQA